MTYNPTIKPPGQSSKDQLIAFVDSRIHYDTLLRAREVMTYRRADLYDQGTQWLREVYTTGANYPTDYMPIAFAPGDPNRLPLPVFNEGFALMVNETARLGRAVFEPEVPTTEDNPSIEVREAAQKAKNVLLYQLKEMESDKVMGQFYNQLPRHGGASLLSYWDETWDDLTMVPVTTAVACAGMAPQMVGSLPIDPASGAPIEQPPGLEPCGFKDATGQHGQCPECGASTQPYEPSLEEAFEGQDSMGQPLGNPVPRGRWKLKSPTGYDLFYENQGIDIDPANVREWVWVEVVPLEEVALRYPHPPPEGSNLGSASKVKAESPSQLQRYHPIAGGLSIFGGGADEKLFRNHVRLKRYYERPKMQHHPAQDGQPEGYAMNRGRYIVVAGDQVLEDSEFLIPSKTVPGEFVERGRIEYVPFEYRDSGRSHRGVGLWELIFDAQDSTNTVRSQIQAINQRKALAPLMARKSHNLEQSGFQSGMPGAAWVSDTDPEAPNAEPHFLDAGTADPGLDAEAQGYLAYMERAAMRSEVEKGNTPSNVGAASAIDLLKTATAETREPRIQRIARMLERQWKHGLELTYHLWDTPRRYGYDDEGDSRWAILSGLDLKGQTNVEIKARPEKDEIREREVIADLIANNVIDPTSDPVLRRNIAEKWGHEARELFKDLNLQEADAQREFRAFLEHEVKPAIDPSLDDPAAHYQEHGRAWHSEKMRALKEAAKWEEVVLPALLPMWDTMLGQLPMMMAVMGPQALQGLDLQTYIERTFAMMLQSGTLAMNPLASQIDMAALQKVLVWRAHIEAHKINSEVQAAKMQMGTPQAEAPGEPVDESGMAQEEGAAA